MFKILTVAPIKQKFIVLLILITGMGNPIDLAIKINISTSKFSIYSFYIVFVVSTLIKSLSQLSILIT